jgi:hypothetical protein
MADAVAAVAEAVEEQAAENIASVVAATDAAIEHAEERAEAAEALSQQIADAALMTELGTRVSAIETECSKWRAVCEGLQTEVAAMTTKLAEMTAAQTTTIIQTPPVLPAPEAALNSSNQAPSPEITTVTVEPGNVPAVNTQEETPARQKAVRKRLI